MKYPHTNRFGSHAEMMRQCYRARIIVAEMEKPIALVPSNILWKVKENDHCGRSRDGNFRFDFKLQTSEVQRTEKLTSNPLVLQSPTHHQISDRSRLYVKQSFSQGQKKGCNDRRYT